jgi:hypothetical protein
LKQIRKRLTYANVMSSIAVFLMLGGATAFAATKIGANQLKANSVKTGKIVKEAVKAGKLAKNAVTTPKIANLAVTTEKIANEAVTGEKANESTFGTVPSANTANSVAGSTIKAVNFTGNPTTGPTEILNLNGFTLTATCAPGDALSVLANGPIGSRLQSGSEESISPGAENQNGVFDDNLTPTSNVELLEEDDDLVVGQTQFYLGTGGKAVTVIWEAESFNASSGPHCTFTGYAIG